MAVDNNVYYALGFNPSSVSAEVTSMLEFFQDTAEKKLRIKAQLLEGDDIPDELSYIIPEYAIRRYNRIGSEGYASHSVEGETISFAEDDIFSIFDEAIEDWLESQTGSAKGKVKFL